MLRTDPGFQSRALRAVRAVAGLVSLTWWVPVCAQPVDYILDPQGSHVTFYGDTTFHKFEGHADRIEGSLRFDLESMSIEGPSEVVIPIDRLDTGLALRDRVMRRMFDVEHYPEIRFTPEQVLTTHQGGHEGHELEGRLVIHGVAKTVAMPITVETSGAHITARGTIDIDMTHFGLTPPSLMRLIRVDEHIRIEFEGGWTAVKR